MKYQTHGDHWDALFKSHEEMVGCVESLAEGSELLYGRETTFNDGDLSRDDAVIFAIEKADGPVSVRGLVYDDKEKSLRRIVSAYPVGTPLSCCSPVCLRHSVDQWDNRIEANIEGDTDCEDSRSVNFFSTDYISHKHAIRLVEKADYSIVAFALDCKIPGPDEMEIRFEGQKAIDFLSKLKKAPEYNERGEVEPVVIGLREMVSFLPMEEDFPDIVQFRSPVSHVEAFTSFGVPMYRMMTTIFREEEDVNITLYARQDFFDHMPQEGEPVHGVMWLQGEMVSDPYATLRDSEECNLFSRVSTSFFHAINGIDTHAYDDLMGLLAPFSDLRPRDGYVIDGFWADRNEGAYTKLYFSAAGSEWRYLPEMVDGKVTPAFDDRMYIHNHVAEELITDLPPLTNYIEGPFTETAIWEMYLLITARYYLPMSVGLGDTYRVLLCRTLDYSKLDDENYGLYSKDERLESGVHMIDGDKAIVSCAFWSKESGLCVEKTVVSKAGNGYRFGVSRILRIA